MRRAVGIALLLWRGELRVQGLIGKHPLLTGAEGIVGGVVLVLVATKVRHLLLTTGPYVPNCALLSVGLAVVVVVNVLVLGPETRTRARDLASWSGGLPLRPSEVRAVQGVSGVLRALLFTAVLVTGVAAGAVSTTGDPVRWLLIAVTAVVLPLAPVAIGLRLGDRRSDPLPQAALAIPLGVVLLATQVPLPDPGHAGVLHVLARPALALLGLATAQQTAVLVFGELALAAWVFAGLARLTDLAPPDGRSPRADVLARVSSRDPRALLVDLVTHRVRGRHFLAAAGLGAVPGLAALLAPPSAGAGPGGAPAGVALALSAAGLVVPAVLAGYGHMTAVTALSPDAERWLRTSPLPVVRLHAIAHLVRTLSALCAGGTFAVVISVVLVGAGRGALAAPLAAAALLSVAGLGGWVGLAMSLSGLPRVLAYYVLLGVAGLRTCCVTVVVLAEPAVPALILVLVLDLLLGGVGQCLLHTRFRRSAPSLRLHVVPA